MAAVDFVEVDLEESPVYEGAGILTPYRRATEKLYLPARSMELAPAPEYLSRADELRGILGKVPDLIDGYAPAGSLSVRAYPKDLTWLFNLAGFVGVPTTGDGIITDPDAQVIPVGVTRWVFTKRAGITPQTAQVKVNYKNEDILLTGNGFAVSSLNLPASGELTADWMGLLLARAAADTTTTPAVASQAIYPFRRGDLFLTWLSGGGVPADFSLSVANGIERVHSLSLDPPSQFPDILEFADDQVLVTGTIPKRVLDLQDLDALWTAATFSAKARWKSTVSIGATAKKYTLWCEMPACQYNGGTPGAIGNTRRRGGDYSFQAAYDETAGYDVKWTLLNNTATINTWA